MKQTGVVLLDERTVDVEVTVIEGRNFRNSHDIMPWTPSHFVELIFDEAAQRTHEGKKDGKRYEWKESFIFAARQSSQLDISVYCKHDHIREDHVIGQVSLDLMKVSRNKVVDIEVHAKTKSGSSITSGSLSLLIKVAATVTYNTGHISTDLQSLYCLNRMAKINESFSTEQWKNIGPIWARFIKSLDAFVPLAEYISELDSRVQIAVGAVTFAVKVLVDQMDRDEKIERLINVMGDLYSYLVDANSMDKIQTYKKTIERLLSQTAECAYFVANYRKIKDFAQRAVVNIVSNADAMISQFEGAFGELKIELILGSSLQGALVSFRILQKVENIENLLYINYLENFNHKSSWDPTRTCLPGTRDTTINDLVQWASITGESTNTADKRLCVLYGPPRCGKSSIAHSIARAFHLQGRLGAAIFLEDHMPVTFNLGIISSTIAFRLAHYDPAIMQSMALKMKANVDLAVPNIGRQFPDLIVAALEELSFVGPICIVIDGLDKIGDPSDRSILLATLSRHSKQLPPNFRIILTSTHGSAKETDLLPPDCKITMLNFDDNMEALDIESYVSLRLERLFEAKPELGSKYTLETLHQEFMRRSMGIPLWISTACDTLLLCDNEFEFVEAISSSSELPRLSMEVMSGLYLTILRHLPLPPDMIQSVFHILMVSTTSHPDVFQLLRSITTNNFQLLQSLGFILDIGQDAENNPILSVHSSLQRFLTDPQLCSPPFYVDRYAPINNIQSMVHHSLDCLEPLLKANTLHLEGLMADNVKISETEIHIPEALRTAAIDWIFLLEVIADSVHEDISATFDRLDTFLSTHFFHWVECINTMGLVEHIQSFLRRFVIWFAKHKVMTGTNTPIGVVRFFINRVVVLGTAEATSSLGGKSDLYVRVQVQHITKGRTEVINCHNNSDPVWDQILYIPVHSLTEIMMLECMDYQNLTKDRSFGFVEVHLNDLAVECPENNRFPYQSKGIQSAAGLLEHVKALGLGMKGAMLDYTAEFIPSLNIKWEPFEVSETVLLIEQASSPISEEEDGPQAIVVSVDVNGKNIAENTKSTESTTSAKNTKTTWTVTDGSKKAEQVDTRIVMSLEELLTHQSGIIVVHVISGHIARKARVEVLVDDGYWPCFSTVRARTRDARWGHVGEVFVKELDFGRIWLRLNAGDENERDEIIGEWKGDTKTFLYATFDGPQTYTLTDRDDKISSSITVEARYIPVPVMLESKESISNQGILRVDLLDGRDLHAAGRGGKSNPYAVFQLNGQKVFRSQTRKKTIAPEWNETFVIAIHSLVKADLSLEIWSQHEELKSLGTAKIDVARLEPFEAQELTLNLVNQGQIRLRVIFQPEIVTQERKNTSTATTASRLIATLGATAGKVRGSWQ